MPYIMIYGEEHEIGEPHYHISSNLGQKKVFKRFEERLPKLLPEGFKMKHYHEDDIGIFDKENRQHMRIYYIQRRFPHNLHIDFHEVSFKPIFTKILRNCFQKADVTWEEENGGVTVRKA